MTASNDMTNLRKTICLIPLTLLMTGCGFISSPVFYAGTAITCPTSNWEVLPEKSYYHNLLTLIGMGAFFPITYYCRQIPHYDEYNEALRAQIRSNLILPNDLVNNPECGFSIKLRHWLYDKSLALDEAKIIGVDPINSTGECSRPDVQKAFVDAILKSSPIPKPPGHKLLDSLSLTIRPRKD